MRRSEISGKNCEGMNDVCEVGHLSSELARETTYQVLLVFV